ncbi:MAG TPA: response regulator transcription factor [Chitinophagales bacterium]|nr:response regulator transcription factor [Chitinophagales bacterium]
MISIVIADDHQMFIDGIKVLLQQEPDIAVVGQALNGKELVDLLDKQSADIILMDINMPVIDGMEATKIIRKKYPAIKVLMLTMYNSRQYITSMIAAGANGYILKNTGKEELTKAIEAIYRGDTYYSQEVTNRVMESFRKKDIHLESNPELTPREKEVLILLAEEFTASEVGDKLNISRSTVEAHRKNMLSKFNVRTTVGLVKVAIERGLID